MHATDKEKQAQGEGPAGLGQVRGEAVGHTCEDGEGVRHTGVRSCRAAFWCRPHDPPTGHRKVRCRRSKVSGTSPRSHANTPMGEYFPTYLFHFVF